MEYGMKDILVQKKILIKIFPLWNKNHNVVFSLKSVRLSDKTKIDESIRSLKKRF